jgi:hypothetical protein
MSGGGYGTPSKGGGCGGGVASPIPAILRDAEVARLKAELDEMYTTLQEKQDKLEMSGNYGKNLMETCADYESRLER